MKLRLPLLMVAALLTACSPKEHDFVTLTNTSDRALVVYAQQGYSQAVLPPTYAHSWDNGYGDCRVDLQVYDYGGIKLGSMSAHDTCGEHRYWFDGATFHKGDGLHDGVAYRRLGAIEQQVGLLYDGQYWPGMKPGCPVERILVTPDAVRSYALFRRETPELVVTAPRHQFGLLLKQELNSEPPRKECVAGLTDALARVVLPL